MVRNVSPTKSLGMATPVHRSLDYKPDDPLLTAAEAAIERRQGLSTFWRDVAAGRIPPAYYIARRSPRWRRSEILASVEALRAPARGGK